MTTSQPSEFKPVSFPYLWLVISADHAMSITEDETSAKLRAERTGGCAVRLTPQYDYRNGKTGTP